MHSHRVFRLSLFYDICNWFMNIKAEDFFLHCIQVMQVSCKRAAQERHSSTELARMWLPPWAVVSMHMILQDMYLYLCRSFSTFRVYIQIHTDICEVIELLLLSQPWAKGQAGWVGHSFDSFLTPALGGQAGRWILWKECMSLCRSCFLQKWGHFPFQNFVTIISPRMT